VIFSHSSAATSSEGDDFSRIGDLQSKVCVVENQPCGAGHGVSLVSDLYAMAQQLHLRVMLMGHWPHVGAPLIGDLQPKDCMVEDLLKENNTLQCITFLLFFFLFHMP